MRWEVKPLGELCSIQNGFAFKSKLFGDDGMPLIRIRDLSNGFETQTRYSGEYDENFVVNAGDVLVGMDGEFRCYKWKGGPALLNQRVCRLEGFDRRLSPRFTQYGINKYLKAIEEVTSFTTVKHLSAKKIKAIQFPIPPVEEQERIVEILDEAFAAIDKVKVNIERNLTNARELFQSRLNDIFSNPAEDWEVKPLGEVCSIVADLVDPRQDEYLSQLHVGGGNIESESGQFIGLKTSAEEGLKSGKFPFTNEDVLYNKIRPYLVKVARPDFEGICSADMYPLRPSEDISRDFLFYALISERFTSYAISVSARAGMPKVNRKDLFNYDISFPLKKEQERITKELDALIEMKRMIEAKYRVELENLEELRQSILEQAFEGKLTEPVAA